MMYYVKPLHPTFKIIPGNSNNTSWINIQIDLKKLQYSQASFYIQDFVLAAQFH